MTGKELAKIFGANIQAWRVQRGYTLAGLAALSGLPAVSVEGLERGAGTISATTIAALSEALDVDPASLFPGSATRDTSPALREVANVLQRYGWVINGVSAALDETPTENAPSISLVDYFRDITLRGKGE